MNNSSMQRYVIALGRGFKGDYRKFLKENRLKESYQERSRRKMGDVAALETHVIACLEIERRVAD